MTDDVARLPDESAEYREARKELRDAELELMLHRERVAELRRGLPADTAVPDYVLHEGPRDLDADGPEREVRLSGLFDDPERPLVVYHFMYGGAQETPCPSCTMWLDGLNGATPHVRRNASFAVIARAPVEELRAWGRKRGWTNHRLVSSSGTSLKRDLRMETEEGAQLPGVSVFLLGEDGGPPRHFYTQDAHLKGDRWRGIDLFTPVWHVLDLLPGGRGDWNPSLDYLEDG